MCIRRSEDVLDVFWTSYARSLYVLCPRGFNLKTRPFTIIGNHQWHSVKWCFPFSISETYLEPCQKSNMELFAKIANGWKPSTIFAKSSILDIWESSNYASAHLDFLSSLFYAIKIITITIIMFLMSIIIIKLIKQINQNNTGILFILNYSYTYRQTKSMGQPN